jgi:DNA repair exonuclease SbcCD ATPase subunit
LDEFSSYYINEWLGELAIIVNDLLKNINITIQFTEEKEFMKVMDNGKSKVYAQLSSGQKTMLSAIFKLAILIHKNETEGIILCDEGFDFMDEANLENFIEVVQPLNFQIVFVYQDLPEMEGINRIDVLRQNNESKIQ